MTRVYADGDGVWREDRGHARLGLSWTAIALVAAYRMEAAAGGHRVLELETARGEAVVLVDKHDGFAHVAEELARRLPGFDRPMLDALAPIDADNDPVVLWRRLD